MAKRNITGRFVPVFVIGLLLVASLQHHANAQQKEKGQYIKVFNGKNLKGWKGDRLYWRVEKGVLIGEVTPSTILKKNSFIIWQGTMPNDFELWLEYRVSDKGNSGINYRSKLVVDEPYALKGYQADIDGEGKWNGQNYEERGREFLALRGEQVVIEKDGKINVTTSLGSKDLLNAFVRKEDWNEYHLVVKGNRMQHYINNVLMSDVTDLDEDHRSFDGFFGVQVHVGPPMKIEYRNFRLKSLNP